VRESIAITVFTWAGEGEKRKDQLLTLQRSKQERTDAELTSIRQVGHSHVSLIFSTLFDLLLDPETGIQAL